MFTLHLHTIGWDGPKRLIGIKFFRVKNDYFAGSGGGEDSELQRTGSDAFLPAHSVDESADLLVGQRGVMLHDALLLMDWQQVIKVTAPARRILACPISPGACPIQHGLNTP